MTDPDPQNTVLSIDGMKKGACDHVLRSAIMENGNGFSRRSRGYDQAD